MSERQKLIMAWVIIGRLENALEELQDGNLNKRGRDELITKMRAMVWHAVASQF